MPQGAGAANLGAVLRRGYAHALERPFLTHPGGRTWTYRQIEEHADELAGALALAGVAVGDRVVVKVAKSVDAVALYLACLRMGAVYVPLNPAFTAAELDGYVADAEPALLVNDPDDEPHRGIPTLTLGSDHTGSLLDAARAARPLDEVVVRETGDLAAMLYTSGTTGRPKGAMLTHGCLAANGRALHEIWGFTGDDVLVHPLPIFHAHGLFVALHCTMLSGARAHFLPRFSVDDALDALAGATVMMAVPTIYTRLLADERFDAAMCAGMRLFTSGSAPMTAAVHRAFTERTGHRILERYGMTEAGMITSNPLHGERVPGSVGFALPGYDVRVATGAGPCAPGHAGVVEVRGEHLFAGYWKLPERTAEAFRPDGFFVTGDVGSLDGEGRLTLQGRMSDMIICGGENIYPKDIEQCLDEAPGVLESAVVGVTDDDLGEVVVAYLVTDAGYDPETVQDWVAQRLARFKHPRRYVVVDSLPRNAMGKVEKHRLRSTAGQPGTPIPRSPTVARKIVASPDSS